MDGTYDVIVAGLGAMGSAAAHQLALRGQRVLGLEQFQPGHDRGSSHGYHRMIRRSSLGHPGYVPLADRSFTLWRELEAASGEELLRITGEIWLVQDAGNQSHREGIAESIEQGFRVRLSEQELAERFPGCRLYDDMSALYEAEAGFIRSEAGIIAQVGEARRHGATIRLDEEVTGWTADGDGVRVDTAQGQYRAGRLIITTGPWAPELLADLRLPMQVMRRVNGFFRPARPDHWSVEQGAPDFLLDVPEGSFYGMPSVGDVGVKIGVSAGEVTTARTVRREIDDTEIDFLRATLDKYLPGAAAEEMRRITCLVTFTPDRNFIVDRHPAYPQVSFGCGFSGGGYKFAPVIGEILADLATEGTTRHDIGFLSARRFEVAAAD